MHLWNSSRSIYAKCLHSVHFSSVTIATDRYFLIRRHICLEKKRWWDEQFKLSSALIWYTTKIRQAHSRFQYVYFRYNKNCWINRQLIGFKYHLTQYVFLTYEYAWIYFQHTYKIIIYINTAIFYSPRSWSDMLYAHYMGFV